MKDTVLESPFKIVDPSDLGNSSSSSNGSDSAESGNRRPWEEIGTILFTFGENHSMRLLFTGLPNPKQSLIVINY